MRTIEDEDNEKEDSMSKKSADGTAGSVRRPTLFPEHFLWGASSSAFQSKLASSFTFLTKVFPFTEKSLPSGRLFLSLNNTATFNNLLLNKECKAERKARKESLHIADRPLGLDR